MKKKILSFFQIITKPSSFLTQALSGTIGWTFPLSVFAVYTFLNAFFLKLKPADFPKTIPSLHISEGWPFAFAVQLVGGIIGTAIFSSICVFFFKIAAKKKFWVKTFFSLFFILLFGVFIARSSSQLACAIFLLAFCAAVFFNAIRQKKNTAYLMKVFLSANLILLLFLPLNVLASIQGSEQLFIVSEITASLWLITILVKAGKTLNQAHIFKFLISLFISAFIEVIFFLSLLKCGIITQETFKIIFLS